MKTLLTAFLACGVAFAQTPAPKKEATPTAGAPNLLNPASLRAKAPEMFKVKMTTTKGDVIIQVNRGWAPLGVDRFYNLIRGGFFKDAAFFRIVPGFVAQFGIPARPDVGAVWEKARIPDDRVIQSNKRGTLTFATAGPNTRTTQIFINFGDNTPLDSQGFAPFGQVLEGMDIVDKFFAGYGEAPRQDLISSQGKAYLDKSFPNLDRILSTTIMPSEPAADKK
jgi:peptidyl-prolyl cis-trans isomerase A (cyclophilin A)